MCVCVCVCLILIVVAAAVNAMECLQNFGRNAELQAVRYALVSVSSAFGFIFWALNLPFRMHAISFSYL